MRIAVLVTGLVLTLGLLMNCMALALMNERNKSFGWAPLAALFIMLIWVVGSGLVLPHPLVSTVLFLFAALIGFTFFNDKFVEWYDWSSASLVLAGFSLLGYWDKRNTQVKDDAKHAIQADVVRRFDEI